MIYAKEGKFSKRYRGQDAIKSRREKGLHNWQQGSAAVEHLIRNFSEPGDIVLDPMCGSGTVGWECKLLSRSSINIDIDYEKAIKVTKDRFKQNLLF